MSTPLLGCGRVGFDAVSGESRAEPPNGALSAPEAGGTAETGVLVDASVAPDASGGDASALDAGFADAGAVDGGATVDGGAIDAGAVDAGAPDAGAIDAGAIDAGAIDAGAIDAGAADAGPPTATCGVPPDPATVSLYRFEDLSGGLLRDEVGARDGATVGGRPAPVPGPPGCGNALPTGSGIHGVVADDPAWELDRGSIDFWFRVPPSRPSLEPFGLVSRDGRGNGMDDGHLSVIYASDGRVAVRAQITSTILFVCSETAPTSGEWVHVGINVGMPEVELYFNGRRESGAGEVFFAMGRRPCGATEITGIAGNAEPWVLGAGAWNSVVGTAAPLVGIFEGGALDEFRVSSQRRDFSTFLP